MMVLLSLRVPRQGIGCLEWTALNPKRDRCVGVGGGARDGLVLICRGSSGSPGFLL